MAGDWIKVEHATPEKPEVFILAERLGVTRDQVLGALIRLWIWADQNTSGGNAITVTPSFLDTYSGIAGFAQGLQQVGWARVTCNATGSVIRFIGLDRHTTQTAKQRALTAKRVALHRWRKRNENVTKKCMLEKRREEKRREEVNTPPPPSLASVTSDFDTAFSRWNEYGEHGGVDGSKLFIVSRKPDGPGGKALRARIKESGLDAVLLVIDYMAWARIHDEWWRDPERRGHANLETVFKSSRWEKRLATAQDWRAGLLTGKDKPQTAADRYRRQGQNPDRPLLRDDKGYLEEGANVGKKASG